MRDVRPPLQAVRQGRCAKSADIRAKTRGISHQRAASPCARSRLSVEGRLTQRECLWLPPCRGAVRLDPQLPPGKRALIESNAYARPFAGQPIRQPWRVCRACVYSQSAANDSWKKSGDLSLAIDGSSVGNPMLARTPALMCTECIDLLHHPLRRCPCTLHPDPRRPPPFLGAPSFARRQNPRERLLGVEPRQLAIALPAIATVFA